MNIPHLSNQDKKKFANGKKNYNIRLYITHQYLGLIFSPHETTRQLRKRKNNKLIMILSTVKFVGDNYQLRLIETRLTNTVRLCAVFESTSA